MIFLKTILSLSVSGSLLALILFGLKSILKNKVSRAFSYYCWLIVLLRLVLPVASPIEISVGEDISAPIGLVQNINVFESVQGDSVAYGNVGHPVPSIKTVEPVKEQSLLNMIGIFIIDNLFAIWLFGAVVSFAWFGLSYAVFSIRIRKSLITPHKEDVHLFKQMCKKRSVGFALSDRVPTPMLIGLFRPTIVVPKYHYVRTAD